MPLRNKGSRDYTMQDLEKLTSTLNSIRKSSKKRRNSESRGKEKSNKKTVNVRSSSYK
jgi:hypothetical protein